MFTNRRIFIESQWHCRSDQKLAESISKIVLSILVQKLINFQNLFNWKSTEIIVSKTFLSIFKHFCDNATCFALQLIVPYDKIFLCAIEM